MSPRTKLYLSLPAVAWMLVLQGCDPIFLGVDPKQAFWGDPPAIYTFLNSFTGKETAVRMEFPSFSTQVNVTNPPGFTFLRQGVDAGQFHRAARGVSQPRGGGVLPPDPDEFQFDPWDLPDPIDDFPLPDPPLPDPWEDPFDLPDPPLDLPPFPDDDLPITDFSPGDLNIVDTGGTPMGYALPEGVTGRMASRALKVVSTIHLGSEPAAIVTSPDKTTLYVAVGGSGDIAVIDRASRTIKSRIKLPSGAQPYSLAITPDGNRLYTGEFIVGTANSYSVDLPGGTVTRLTAPGSVMTQMLVTPDGTQLWVCNYFGSIYIYDVLTNTYVTTLGISSPWNVAFNASGTRAYVSSGSQGVQGSVVVVDTATLKTVATIPVGIEPRNIRITPSGRHLFVTNYNSDFVSQIDTGTNQVIRNIPIGDTGASALILAHQ